MGNWGRFVLRMSVDDGGEFEGVGAGILQICPARWLSLASSRAVHVSQFFLLVFWGNVRRVKEVDKVGDRFFQFEIEWKVEVSFKTCFPFLLLSRSQQ